MDRTSPETTAATWRSFLERLEARVGTRDMDSWIRPALHLDSLQGDTVILRATGRFTYEWIVENLTHAIESTWADLLGRPITVKIVVDAPVTEAVAPQRRATNSIDPRMTFDTFIVGKCNEFAHAAAQAVADAPGQAHNPLFIYGHTGLGKTHLLHAIGNRAAASGLRVFACTAELFFNLVVQAVKHGTVTEFRQRFREEVDVLLLDDVQFIAGRERTEEETFHAFEALRAAGKQIVLTADEPPSRIGKLTPRLRTRFECGLLADVQPPDVETMMAILETKAGLLNLDIPPDLQYAIAQRVRNSVRELEGVLNRLSALHGFYGKPITLQFVQDRMADVLPPALPPPNADRILSVVSEHYNVRIQDIRGIRRPANIVRPRQVAMYLCRTLANLSYPEIGRVFARDNSTVQHGFHKIEDILRTDPNVRAEIELLERRLREG